MWLTNNFTVQNSIFFMQFYLRVQLQHWILFRIVAPIKGICFMQRLMVIKIESKTLEYTQTIYSISLQDVLVPSLYFSIIRLEHQQYVIIEQELNIHILVYIHSKYGFSIQNTYLYTISILYQVLLIDKQRIFQARLFLISDQV